MSNRKVIDKVKLYEICDIKSGGTPSRGKREYWSNGEIPWVKIGDFNGKYIDTVEETITYEGLKNSSAKMIEKGSILFTIFATIGEVAILKFDVTTNQAIAGITVIDSRVEKEYLYYYLKSIKTNINNKGRGVAQNNINLSILKNLEVPIVSLKYQKNIVNILNRIDYIIELRIRQLNKINELTKSLFIEMFGDPISNPKEWKKKKCKNILTKIGSGATPQGGSESYKEEGISLIRSMNVHNGRFESKDLAYIDEKQAQKLDNVNIKENDVLINITGASVARCCIVPSDVIPARVNQHVSVLRCSDMVNSIFLCYQIINDSYQNLLKKIGISGGATREAITKKQIEDLEMILPPLELQNKFANFVRGTDKSKLAVKKSLEELEILKKSLMQKYFA